MASTSRMDPSHSLWCYACSHLNPQPRGGQDEAGGNGCARCGSPATAMEAVVDVVDPDVFLNSCHPDAMVRATAEAVQLPTVTVRDAGRDCAVCMEALEPGSCALATPCGHAYHPRCVVPWLEARGTCPLCRAHVGAGDRDGLVLCRFHGGRVALGRRVAGRVFHVRVLDADGKLKRPRGLKGMLLSAVIEVKLWAMRLRDRGVMDLEDVFVS